ncbi:MAG: addiction module protein [Desulfococcaceae bacterium]
MLAMNHPIINQIEKLSDIEKLQIIDIILAKLDSPDPEIDKCWAEESKTRWSEYRAGNAETISYREAMSKYRNRSI